MYKMPPFINISANDTKLLAFLLLVHEKAIDKINESILGSFILLTKNMTKNTTILQFCSILFFSKQSYHIPTVFQIINILLFPNVFFLFPTRRYFAIKNPSKCLIRPIPQHRSVIWPFIKNIEQNSIYFFF